MGKNGSMGGARKAVFALKFLGNRPTSGAGIEPVKNDSFRPILRNVRSLKQPK